MNDSNHTVDENMIEFVHTLADAAGHIIHAYFRNLSEVEHKDAGSPIVTIADKEAERVMREMIEKAYPDHGIIGEEFGVKEGNSPYKWILDPIDGTIAFTAGKPVFGCLIGLMYNANHAWG